MNSMKYLFIILFSFFISFTILIACEQHEVSEERHEVAEETLESAETGMATAVIHPTEGNEASGVVVFTNTDDGVRVQASISGLDPDSQHGFHIHEYGDCRESDGTSAGGHFNPIGMPHGAPTDDERHLGDLGNLQSDENGVATTDFVDTHLELNGRYSIIGYAVIVHAERDDLETQPTGDAGARIGCGIIGVANPDF